MKHIVILAAALVIALSDQAFARLGQTEDQVNALFGKPTDPGKPDSDGITTNMYKNPTGEYLAVTALPNRMLAWIAGSFRKKNYRSFSREILPARNGKKIRASSSGREAITTQLHGAKR